jgi:hypothetical protein
MPKICGSLNQFGGSHLKVEAASPRPRSNFANAGCIPHKPQIQHGFVPLDGNTATAGRALCGFDFFQSLYISITTALAPKADPPAAKRYNGRSKSGPALLQ